MIPPRKRPIIFLALVSFLLLFFFFPRDRDALRLGLSSPPTLFQNNVLAANKTLGFGAILAVSKEGSSRRPALLQAANVTDIDITIPQQPVWTEEQVDKFRNGEDSGSRGSILAWLGHHHALQWFLDSGKETVLILEDDVDWDIHLRSVQAPLAATAVRMMLPSNDDDKNNTHYWGDEGAWDLLYLGHCGDYFAPVGYEGLKKDFNPDMETIPHLLFKDPSLLAKPELHPFTASLFDKINVPDHTRVLHRSQFPLCTFGYAVTRAGAERLLTDLAPPQLKPKPAPHAFDVAVLHACIKGSGTPSPTPEDNPHPHPDPALRHKYASPGLRCWSLNPELFHHMPGGSQIAEIAQASNGKPVGVPPVDAIAADQVALRNETTNIGCGFWGGGFAFDENDTERLAYLQEEVGRKGKCLKEGRDS